MEINSVPFFLIAVPRRYNRNSTNQQFLSIDLSKKPKKLLKFNIFQLAIPIPHPRILREKKKAILYMNPLGKGYCRKKENSCKDQNFCFSISLPKTRVKSLTQSQTNAKILFKLEELQGACSLLTRIHLKDVIKLLSEGNKENW